MATILVTKGARALTTTTNQAPIDFQLCFSGCLFLFCFSATESPRCLFFLLSASNMRILIILEKLKLLIQCNQGFYMMFESSN